jgi:hypothetical protein
VSEALQTHVLCMCVGDKAVMQYHSIRIRIVYILRPFNNLGFIFDGTLNQTNAIGNNTLMSEYLKFFRSFKNGTPDAEFSRTGHRVALRSLPLTQGETTRALNGYGFTIQKMSVICR